MLPVCHRQSPPRRCQSQRCRSEPPGRLLGLGSVGVRLGDAEVRDFEPAIGRERQVGRLDVPLDERFALMGVDEGIKPLLHQRLELVPGEMPAGQTLPEIEDEFAVSRTAGGVWSLADWDGAAAVVAFGQPARKFPGVPVEGTPAHSQRLARSKAECANYAKACSSEKFDRNLDRTGKEWNLVKDGVQTLTGKSLPSLPTAGATNEVLVSGGSGPASKPAAAPADEVKASVGQFVDELFGRLDR